MGNYPQPDYSGVVRSAQMAAEQGARGISQAIGVVTDYAKEQKELAKKDKEMAARIKGTVSLLDNAKALYPDLANQIETTKLQLVDPSLSNLDKLGIASQSENILNMIIRKGTESAMPAGGSSNTNAWIKAGGNPSASQPNSAP